MAFISSFRLDSRCVIYARFDGVMRTVNYPLGGQIDPDANGFGLVS